MRLIKPSFEIIEQQPGILGLYKQIELAGRTCYRSEDKITPDSAAAFVDRMIKSGHGAMLEHGTVYLKIDRKTCKLEGANLDFTIGDLLYNPYTKCNTVEGNSGKVLDYVIYVTTNYRVIVENDWMFLLQYICEPTEYHEKRITVKWTCDRGVSHEFVRHRVFSFAQESTRYCNYSKDKFGNELTFIIPCWLDYKEQQFTDKYDSSIRVDLSEHEYFVDLLLEAEDTYNFLTQYCNWKPQEARAILPNSLKTELVMTGFASDWKHFFKLRDAGSAHPQARELAAPLHEEFIRRGLLQ